MQVVTTWVKTNNEPITQQYILAELTDMDYPESTVKASIKTLARKGYLRKTAPQRRPIRYVLLRTL